ncbi:hypothetical protein QNH96_23650, partial [Klebsiella pneumoniae]|nr:hypothetical protein [Klebsiella pneumoniae]
SYFFVCFFFFFSAEDGIRGLVRFRWLGKLDNYPTIQEQKSTQAMLSEKNNGGQLTTCGEERRRGVRVNPEAGRFGEDSSRMILAGK